MKRTERVFRNAGNRAGGELESIKRISSRIGMKDAAPEGRDRESRLRAKCLIPIMGLKMPC